MNIKCNNCGLHIHAEGVQTHLILRGFTHTINVEVDFLPIMWYTTPSTEIIHKGRGHSAMLLLSTPSSKYKCTLKDSSEFKSIFFYFLWVVT